MFGKELSRNFLLAYSKIEHVSMSKPITHYITFIGLQIEKFSLAPSFLYLLHKLALSALKY